LETWRSGKLRRGRYDERVVEERERKKRGEPIGDY